MALAGGMLAAAYVTAGAYPAAVLIAAGIVLVVLAGRPETVQPAVD